MKINTNPVRGTRDFGPQEMELRDYVTNVIMEIYRNHGFTRIQTPVLENIDLLLGSDGGENLKLIYKILKRGNKIDLSQENLKEIDLVDMGLRYDLTLPLSRFYANNYSILPSTFKGMQIGEVFRAERPQKGRYRSFYQCDIDIIGEESEIAELELILTTSEALLALEFKDFIIRINDRRILTGLIQHAGFKEEDVNSICITFDKLDKIGLEGVEKELKGKEYSDEIINKFIAILTDINQGIEISEMEKFGIEQSVLNPLSNLIDIVEKQSKGKFKIKFDPTIVRGMGYYTGIIYEIQCDGLGVSIAGGGRYDKMIGQFMKSDVPAVGFSIGFERILSIMQDKNFKIPNSSQKIAFLFDKEKDHLSSVIEKSDELRADKNIVALIQKGKKIGKQLDNLKEQGFDSFCIYGEEIEVKKLG
ncbi:histidine--tRNA ligase [Clostridium grantii]|uniref:Histidine--tRNA ligase n=1 Tax=Clostridium grantii DSM 8605 TaxID=1121316 RepID=A0A1M5SJ44_9CLOT|nr:histidine--tRNA ligase [Clostridium grantii]SHH38485.1 histidyl-tRNA synthetase [Clostridium grantii DSM 8605]